jgi:predicted CXXCH cytochrome family protein
MDNNKWWGPGLGLCFALALLVGPIGSAQGAYVDCRMCHLDPLPDSGAKDYYDFFASSGQQHPSGMAYPSPQNQEFYRPTALRVDVSFFDDNGNAVADEDEVQLFGVPAMVECASCHREHGDAPAPSQPRMYLRVAADRLCMICHRL